MIFGFQTNAQLLEPVKWTYSVEQSSPSEATLILTASIDNKFHLYSQYINGDGPLPTIFTFNRSPDYELVGKTSEPNAKEEYEPVFEMNLKVFDKKAVFKQKIRIKNKNPFRISGNVSYMTCDDTQCLLGEDEFEFTLHKDVKTKTSVEPDKNPSTNIKENSTTASTKNAEIEPQKDSIVSDDSSSVETNLSQAPQSTNITFDDECGSGTESAEHTGSLWGIFLGGLLGGLLALLTPCVFPMIPMTVSFFTKHSTTRSKGVFNAWVYALSIILIYVTLGLLITVSFGSDALNAMASNSFFNLLFFVIFLVFAFSFFGAFEITLPSKWINKADQASEKGGMLGLFFMAFTLSLVSFSCTGPIIGTLLVEAAHGRSYLGPVIGMTGFATALALPFGLFAAFPSWLHSLPKSGGWLNSVKVCLGFIELALALKFLSNVDLAYHWGILKREIFIGLWVIIFGLMGLYLIGKIKFSHDSELKYLSVPRLLFAILTFSFTIYLLPGIWGAPLKMISGFPPPEFYKEWITENNSGHCPHNLNCFHDYEEGMAYARAQGKPAMVDFTGWSCVNCRKMEDYVWSDPKILKKLSEDYVLISLYVDDKTPLPENQQYTSTYTGKKIRTTGNKWSELQASVYNTNSQPYYVLLDHKGNLLAQPRGYTPDVDEYASFLEEGKCRFKNR